ncbi:MAG: urease accessory protein UreF [Planctomycetaceae bacterium]
MTTTITAAATRTATTARTPTGDGAAAVLELMRVMQFGDSVLPVGAFTFSGGLESAVQQGVVRDVDTLREFVRTAVRQAATGDAIAVIHAHRAGAAGDLGRVVAIDRAVLLRKLNEEVRTMTTRMGRKLAELAEHVTPGPVVAGWLAAIKSGASPGTYPVGQALVFAGQGLTERDAFAAHQYGVASMLVGAAVRLMRIDHRDAQTVLFDANSSSAADFEESAAADLDDMATFAPVAEILAGVHVRSHVRMFMS